MSGRNPRQSESLADSIKEAVSGAISRALAPVLQSLGQGPATSNRTHAQTGVPHVGHASDDEDFQPVAKKRYIGAFRLPNMPCHISLLSRNILFGSGQQTIDKSDYFP